MARNPNILYEERTYNKEYRDIKMGAYLLRESFYEKMIHQQDDLKNIGFDWRPNLMKKSLSSYLLSNGDVSMIVDRFNSLLVDIVNRIQDIRKFVNYTVSKNYKYIS
jgi:hypothetical protein